MVGHRCRDHVEALARRLERQPIGRGDRDVGNVNIGGTSVGAAHMGGGGVTLVGIRPGNAQVVDHDLVATGGAGCGNRNPRTEHVEARIQHREIKSVARRRRAVASATAGLQKLDKPPCCVNAYAVRQRSPQIARNAPQRRVGDVSKLGAARGINVALDRPADEDCDGRAEDAGDHDDDDHFDQREAACLAQSQV